MTRTKGAYKIKDPDVRQEAYKSFCAHISLGKSRRSWYFYKGFVRMGCRSIEKYIKELPHEFDPLEMEIAEAKGYGVWEQRLIDVADGKARHASCAALQMAFRNMFGWDRLGYQVSPTEDNLKHFQELRNYLVSKGKQHAESGRGKTECHNESEGAPSLRVEGAQCRQSSAQGAV